MLQRTFAMIAVLTSLCGCAGEGEGLNENGRPLAGGASSLTPQLQSIEDHVFTPLCATCHSGAAAPLGLRLDGDAAYAMLVNAPSIQVAALARVVPGNPGASYLIQKLEGTAAVGGRMPLNGPAVPPETIAVIRQWIADGAAASVDVPAAQLAKVVAAWPPPDARIHDSSNAIVLSSNVELDTTLLSAGTVTLRSSGGDGDFENGNEEALHTAITVRSLQPTVIALSAPSDEWVADQYELRISGGAPLALADRSARAIDGDEDGLPGGDFVLRFTVERMK